VAWLRFSSEGLSLAGYLAAPAGPRPSDHGVVLCHGYPNKGRGAENSGKSFPQLADRLSESLGWPVLTINFRGCAKSEGDFSLDGWQHDIAAAIDEVAALGIAHVWLVGFGTGGSLCICEGASNPKVAGVAAAEALHGCGYPGVRLKWPNDLLVADRKLGGLLVEGGGEHAGPVRAVIGLGVNVRMPETAAASIDQPWIDLAGLQDKAPSRNRIAAGLLAHLVPALEQFDAEGLAPFLSRYARFDALAGRMVAIHLGAVVHSGIALGIAGDGALRVEIGGAERLFHAGEVSVRPQ